MPVVLRVRNLRFYFYAHEHGPAHVHVTIGKASAYPHVKILLETLEVQSVQGFSKIDVAKILEVAETFQEPLLDSWEEHFGEKE